MQHYGRKAKKKDIVICPKSFFYGDALAEELTKLRRFVIDMAAQSENSTISAAELGDRLFVLNYLIEDVAYKWDFDNKHQE